MGSASEGRNRAERQSNPELQEELAERTKWALDLKEEIAQRDEVILNCRKNLRNGRSGRWTCKRNPSSRMRRSSNCRRSAGERHTALRCMIPRRLYHSSRMSRPALSIVIPFLNEEKVLPLLRRVWRSVQAAVAGSGTRSLSATVPPTAVVLWSKLGGARPDGETHRPDPQLWPSKRRLGRALFRLRRGRRGHGRRLAG